MRGKKANIARAHIRAIAIQRGVRDQSSLGVEGYKSFVLKCVTSCEQLRHLDDQVHRWASGNNVTKDLNKVRIALEHVVLQEDNESFNSKVGVALEYVIQEALRAGRVSGALSSRSAKRRRCVGDSTSPGPSGEAVAAAASETHVAIRVVFVRPEEALKTKDAARWFTYFWPPNDDSHVPTITSITRVQAEQTMQALAASAVANMPNPDREIRSIWGVTEEGGVYAPRKEKVFLIDSDEAVKGWLVWTSNLVEPTIFVVYRRPSGDPRPNTPIPGNRPFFSHAAHLPRECDVYIDIAEEEDDELSALQKEPQSLPWSRSGLAMKERIVGMRIIRQQRLLRVLRARARGFYEDWEDTDVLKDEVSWMAGNRYIVNPPEVGSEDVPRR